MAAEERNISVLIPVWNGAEFLGEALASVQPEANHVLEIIVLDDGSTDDTPRIARSAGALVRYERQEHAGLAAARNAALRLAEGELLAFLDADDLWPPGRLAHLRRVLDADGRAAIAQGRLQRLTRSASGDWEFVAEAHRAPSLCTALIRRSAFEVVGDFDERFLGGHDVDWLMRAREAGVGEAQSDAITLHYRRHDGNMTNDVAVDQPNLLRVLRASIERRRIAGREPT